LLPLGNKGGTPSRTLRQTTLHMLDAPTPADCRALKARIAVTYEDIAERVPYQPAHLRKVFREHKRSAPALRAAHDALLAMQAERTQDEAPAL